MTKRPADRVKKPHPEGAPQRQQTATVTRLPVAPFRSRGVLLQLVRDLPLSGTPRALMLEMAGIARLPTTGDPVCWGTHKYWAGRLSCSPRTVLRALQLLRAKGLINVRHRGRKGGGRTSTTYYLQAALIRALAHGGRQRRQQKPQKRVSRSAPPWKPISRRKLAEVLKKYERASPLEKDVGMWKRLLESHGLSDGTDNWQNLRSVLWLSHWRNPEDSWSHDLHRRVVNHAAKKGDSHRWATILARSPAAAEEYLNE